MKTLVCLFLTPYFILIYLSIIDTSSTAISFDAQRVIRHARDVIADALIQQITTGDSTHQEYF